MVVEQLSDTETVLGQIDLQDPDAPRVLLNVVRVNDAYELRSLSFETHFNRLWIFGSAQELVGGRILGCFLKNDEFGLSNRHALGLQQQIAEILVATAPSKKGFDVAVDGFHRGVYAEHVLWRFETPSSLRGTTFETGVNLVPGTREPICEDKDCSELR